MRRPGLKGPVIPSEAWTLTAFVLICAALRNGVGYHDVDVMLIGGAALLSIAAGYTAQREPGWLIWSLVAVAIAATSSYLVPPSWRYATAAAALGAMLLARWFIGPWLAVAAAALTLVPMFWRWTWGRGEVDVFNVVQQAAGQVLRLRNPYDLLVSVSGRINGRYAVVKIHFPYGPTVPLLAAPARWLGDIRVASLAMMLVFYAGVALLARRSAAGVTPRRRLLTLSAMFPLAPVMLLSAWVDVYAAAGLALWVALSDGHRRWAVVALAGALATKPTVLLVLIPAFIWSRRGRREILAGALLAALVCVPFALITGIDQFVRDTAIVPFQMFPDPRPDATTLDAWLLHHGYPILPGWAAPAGVALVGALVLWRRPRDWGDLLLAASAMSTVGFLLAKQAFYNYYFLSAALLLLALAGRGVPFDSCHKAGSTRRI